MKKNILMGISGLMLGYLAMVGMIAFLSEWAFMSAFYERQRIRQIVYEIVLEEVERRKDG